MKTLTFRDFCWSSHHYIPSKHGAAAHPHWHSYRARLWFSGCPDQDQLSSRLEEVFGRLHGSALNSIMKSTESSDENLAKWIFDAANAEIGACARVVVENDGKRGAEVAS